MAGNREHHYQARVRWTGNLGRGTSTYRDYSRAHEITAGAAPPIPGSADPAFRGDAARYNPEQLLVGALSACHMLWYLHLCADAGIVVVEYEDEAAGGMNVAADGSGGFAEVVLRPRVTLAHDSDLDAARALHEQAHERCNIARSVNFPVRCDPVVDVESAASGESPLT